MIIREARSKEEIQDFVMLVAEYLNSLPFELDFQDVEGELANPEREYSRLSGGVALVAYVQSVPVGCIGLRRLEPGVGELKRMFVAPDYRGAGIAKELCSRVLGIAREVGYEAVKLDTVAEMIEAISLYEGIGFVATGRYRLNPLPSARFFEIRL